MTLNEYFKSKPKAELEELAKSAGTTYENLQQIFVYGGSVSTGLAVRIVKATSGEVKIGSLKPDLALLDSEVA